MAAQCCRAYTAIYAHSDQVSPCARGCEAIGPRGRFHYQLMPPQRPPISPFAARVTPRPRKTRFQVSFDPAALDGQATLSCVGSVHRASMKGFSDSAHSHPPFPGCLAQTPFLRLFAVPQPFYRSVLSFGSPALGTSAGCISTKIVAALNASPRPSAGCKEASTPCYIAHQRYRCGDRTEAQRYKQSPVPLDPQ